MEGYIKLYRKIIESPVFQNERLLKAFIWCLAKATHREREEIVGIKCVKLQKGQFVFGRKKAAQELGFPESTTWRYMKALQSFGILDIKSNSKFSVVTVVNWEKYQCLEVEYEQQNGHEVNKRWTRGGQEVDTNKNVKNVKKYTYTPDEMQEVVDAYNCLCPSLPRCTTLSDKRKKTINARFKAGWHMDDFEEIFRAAEKSDFLSGRKGKWKAGFDWLLNENNMIKVLEGNYDNDSKRERPPGAEEENRPEDCDYSKFFTQ